MRIPRALMPHKVLVRAAAGHGADGQAFDPPKPNPAPQVRAYVEDKTRLVRDGSGQEVTSTSSVWIDLGMNVPELSEVTIRPGQPNERTRQVVAVTVLDHPRTPSHQILYLA